MPCVPRTVSQAQRCVDFANSIGIKARISRRRWQNEFLPGILVWRGALFVNPDHTLGYDDVLHEIGHLAILPSVIRRHATGDVEQSIRRPADKYLRNNPFMVGYVEDPVERALLQAGDQEAMAWGFAAQVHLGLSPKTRFMVMGGTSLSWREANADEIAADLLVLSHGRHPGVHGLAAAGMTTTKTFPKMIRWAQP